MRVAILPCYIYQQYHEQMIRRPVTGVTEKIRDCCVLLDRFVHKQRQMVRQNRRDESLERRARGVKRAPTRRRGEVWGEVPYSTPVWRLEG